MLLKYLVDTFWNQLVKFESLPAIHFLKVKYDQVLILCDSRFFLFPLSFSSLLN